MALQGSGQISFSQLESEFGRNGKRSLGDYRVSDDFANQRGGAAVAVGNMPLDDGIPQSGEIKFSDFYNKRLNVIVDYYSRDERTRVDARRKWNNRPQDTRCVGGFRTRPANSSGTKVILHVNDTIKSEKSNDKRRVAFRTGSWNGGTDLRIDVGDAGKILGAGGDGGKGADNENERGKDGKDGTSGLGLAYPATIRIFSGGVIAGGGGGGGGGGGAYDTDKWDDELAAGGGGGGGAGGPSGSGGRGGNSWEPNNGADGQNGSNGSNLSGGGGGNGGNQDNEARGGRGGRGGNSGENGESGQGGNGEYTSGGGSGGNHGYWLVTGGNSYNLALNQGTAAGGTNGGGYS
tara:strand:+ start:1974 stop:3017 length:1044 start_codon:yes stop_codon:yes gene_type:complete